MRILVVEDDHHIATGLRSLLTSHGHSVDWVDDGRKGEAAALSGVYQLLIIDIGLPFLEGGEVIRRARASGIEAPIIVVSAADSLGERVRLLDLGADDYLTKPFAIAEFEARVRAQVRRATSRGRPDIEVGDLRIDAAGQRVRCRGLPLALTAREFALLLALATQSERVVPRSHLIEAVCSWDEELTDNGLDIALHRLRRKLEGSSVELLTVRGLGYMLRPGVEAELRAP